MSNACKLAFSLVWFWFLVLPDLQAQVPNESGRVLCLGASQKLITSSVVSTLKLSEQDVEEIQQKIVLILEQFATIKDDLSRIKFRSIAARNTYVAGRVSEFRLAESEREIYDSLRPEQLAKFREIEGQPKDKECSPLPFIQ